MILLAAPVSAGESGGTEPITLTYVFQPSINAVLVNLESNIDSAICASNDFVPNIFGHLHAPSGRYEIVTNGIISPNQGREIGSCPGGCELIVVPGSDLLFAISMSEFGDVEINQDSVLLLNFDYRMCDVPDSRLFDGGRFPG